MDFLNNQITISLNTPFLIVIIFFILSLVVAVIFLVVRLRKETIYKPKYGFLGKSLYPIVTVALLVVGLVTTGLSMNEQKIFELKAQKQIEAEIYTNVLDDKGDSVYIDIKTTPFVDSKVWGNVGDEFDIYWDLKGPKEYNFVELKKTNETRSGIQTEIVPGKYKVSITVVFEDSVYIFSKEATF
jgi:hypothetical protein